MAPRSAAARASARGRLVGARVVVAAGHEAQGEGEQGGGSGGAGGAAQRVRHGFGLLLTVRVA